MVLKAFCAWKLNLWSTFLRHWHISKQGKIRPCSHFFLPKINFEKKVHSHGHVKNSTSRETAQVGQGLTTFFSIKLNKTCWKGIWARGWLFKKILIFVNVRFYVKRKTRTKHAWTQLFLKEPLKIVEIFVGNEALVIINKLGWLRLCSTIIFFFWGALLWEDWMWRIKICGQNICTPGSPSGVSFFLFKLLPDFRTPPQPGDGRLWMIRRWCWDTLAAGCPGSRNRVGSSTTHPVGAQQSPRPPKRIQIH